MVRSSQLLVVLLMACVAPRLCWSQTIENASFEDDPLLPTGWTRYGVGAWDADVRVWTVPTFATSEAPDGERVFGIVKDGTRTSVGMYQQVSGVTVGVNYKVAAQIFTHRTGNGEMKCALGIDPTGGIDPDSANVRWFDPIHSDDEWRRIAISSVAQDSTITIFITMHQSGTDGFAINYVDAVELIADPPLLRCPTEVSTYSTFQLDDRRLDLEEQIEAQYTVPEGFVITGIGARGSEENVSRMRVRQQRLLPDGTLGEPQEIRFGYDPFGDLEANITLPDCYVAVGYGARAGGEWDVMTLIVWARLLQPDGTLGPLTEFRAGYEAYHAGVEREFIAPQVDRVLTGVGMRMRFSDITNIWAETDRFSMWSFPGDCDLDDDVDQEDFGYLQSCVTGPNLGPVSTECRIADLDKDGDVDDADIAIFINCMSGPDQPVDPECAG